MRNLAASAALAATLSLAAFSWADAVPMIPPDCPPGTHGVTSHAGPGCVRDDCPPGSIGMVCVGGPCCMVRRCEDAGAACHEGACQSVRLCVKGREANRGW